MNELRLQQLLTKQAGLDPEQVADLNHEAVKTSSTLEEVILRRGLLTHQRLYELMAEEMGLPCADLECYLIEPDTLQLVPAELARRFRVVPLFLIGSTLSLATSNPDDVAGLDQLRRELQLEISPVLASPESIAAALDRYYPPPAAAAVDAAAVAIEADEAARYVAAEDESKSAEQLSAEGPVVTFVNHLLEQAIAERASDIHIEPEADKLRVRLRVDGMLRETGQFPLNLHPVVSSRIKILGGLDISEKRRPQDGQFEYVHGTNAIDVRVSSFPTVHGENLVLRLLDKNQSLRRLTEIGMSPEDAGRFERLIRQPHGMILVTGPTGSGKTTTLYSALALINSPERSIMTLEDPVEYHLPLIRQTQVNPRAGLTFAAGLRSILRQDPDVILVGEVRDVETARIAFQAALTGHLVLATLHTNDAASGLTRLIDMDIEPFLIASSVIAILAQRLARRICDRCAEPYHPLPEITARLNLGPDETLRAGRGCPSCANRGYRGRIGVFELLSVTPEVRRLVMQHRSAEEIASAAIKEGMRTLRDDAIAKARAGLTTPEEVLRVTASADS
ncbi:MAG: GspE/PulE family protein [candidate division WOR-3 bacterium]